MLRTIELKPGHGFDTSVHRRELRVGGLTPFTSIDFPGRLSAVIFVQGCPLRCGYCHNPHLQQRKSASEMRWTPLLEWLHKRTGLLDGVVFSGGEPTVDPMLKEAIMQVRALGFSIGLHSAGTHPRRMREILPHIDWIGLDIKAPLDDVTKYERIAGARASALKAEACLQSVLSSGIEYEVRTTAHSLWLDDSALLQLSCGLAARGVKRFALQLARATPHQPAPHQIDYPAPATLQQIDKLFQHFSVRNEPAHTQGRNAA
ncbi:anaerobic ribonucleoside-triphosphate reductase activating protein [Diaphorobacter sp. HDW4A]|uniref:anaerobic ribonucleoside-triphosphate reductase activating protein n=1 Tax=Diaphorobacter sp. HDW4A TaxID=2714924 RepID=UPI00140B92F8|nr:anaerobic ribonucleoside-triphosphate reductase activating protein [Diaphorobacter sp. HDW4A]QIL79645.1 anaerobic ribonucleoside-triphosphate reductase activating protein [Diaphorobacter sp. HDW4A]